MNKILPVISLALLAACAVTPAENSAASTDLSAQSTPYSYPEPTSKETVNTIVVDTPLPPYQVRVQLATTILERNANLPEIPKFIPVLEGEDRETLVLVAIGQTDIDTVYKARALASGVTSIMRNNPLFLEYGVQNDATVFDMLKIWGFAQLVVTNGEDFAHVFLIE